MPNEHVRHFALLALLLTGTAGCARTSTQSTITPLPRSGLLTPADVPAGTRVRYHVRDDWRGLRTGNVVRATRDTVWLAPDRPLPVARLRRLDVSLGGGPSEERRMGRGAMIGAAAGALVGAIVPRDSAGTRGAASRARYAGLGAMYGMFFGGVAALLLVDGEQWERVELPMRSE